MHRPIPIGLQQEDARARVIVGIVLDYGGAVDRVGQIRPNDITFYQSIQRMVGCPPIALPNQ
jgi:hypothetical protein